MSAELEQVILGAFRAGMHYAARLKFRCDPNECDGVDAMKMVIRNAAMNLKELPPEMSATRAAFGKYPPLPDIQPITTELAKI